MTIGVRMKTVMYFLIYGAIFLVFSTLGLWYLHREYQRFRRLSRIGLLVLVSLFALQGYYAYYWMMGPEGYNPLSQAAPIGFVLMAIGLAITAAGMFLPRRFRCWLGMDHSNLVTNRLYRFTRNPQYVGYFVLQVGACVAWWNFAAWIGPVSLIFLIHPLVLIEEKHLRAVYGDAYYEYCERVPRYLI